MIDVTLDFETYYDTAYSLRKMPPLLYVRDPRFKVHGCAIKVGDDIAEWVPGDEFSDAWEHMDRGNIRCISHNALFDMLVLREHYGFTPKQYVDTLGLCRAMLPQDLDFSLGKIAPLLGLGEKGKELVLSKGIRDLPPEIEEQIARYAENDADLAYGIYLKLWGLLPSDERRLMDMTIRMGTDGVLCLDRAQAESATNALINSRDDQLRRLGVTMTTLRSRDKFADLLRARGVEPPTKLNKNGVETYAFSKQDPAFVKLQADPRCADLVAARLAVSSNNAITRAQNFIKITDHFPHTLPMPLNYWGAHTGRWSGAGKLNVQNLNRGGGLRESLVAPPGHVIVVVDSSQIELRFNMWFSGQEDILELQRTGGDIYKVEAARQLGKEVEDVTKEERNLGKVVQLACGYGMGWRKFQMQCAVGIMGNKPMALTDERAKEIINKYRENNADVNKSWAKLQGLLPSLSRTSTNQAHKHLWIKHETIVLPGGMELQYPNLEPVTETDWEFGTLKKKRIYGGLLQENIVQASARKIIADQMLAVDDYLKTLPITRQQWAQIVSQTHDEIIVVVPEEHAEQTHAFMVEAMSKSPDWAPDLPLGAEGGWAHNYSK